MLTIQEDWHDYVSTQDGMYVSVEEAEQRERVLRDALIAVHDVLVSRFWLQEPDDCMKYVSRVNWSLLKENARTALCVPNRRAGERENSRTTEEGRQHE